MDDEYQAYMLNSALGDPTGGFGGMPNYTDNDPLGGDMPPINPPDAVDPNDPLGGDMPPINPPDAVDPNDPLGGGTPPGGGGGGGGGGGTGGLPDAAKNFLRGLIVGEDGKPNPMGLLGIMGLLTAMSRGSGTPAPVGYQGGVPKYTAVRERVAMPADPNRRPGSGGRRYFSDTQYVPEKDVSATKTKAQEQAKALTPAITPDPKTNISEAIKSKDNAEAAKKTTSGFGDFYASPEYAKYSANDTGIGTMDMYQSPYFGMISSGSRGRSLDEAYKSYLSRTGATPVYAPKTNVGVQAAAQGGLMNLARGRYLNGSTDGMADKIPANIEGTQPAKLSHGEFVIPADVVSHLGNGNSESGAQRLYDMMDKIRKARTGTPKQGKQINPDKFLPR